MKQILILLFFSVFTLKTAYAADSLYISPVVCDSSTVIHFSISQNDTVTLEVFNVMGSTMHTFFLNSLLPAGSYALNYQTYSASLWNILCSLKNKFNC
ncbi:MAG: hypothetical protein JSU07_07160 [Bacteroidetes bacterium]|nr:hypothetical protein [Bacteroidota bacterium]